MECPNCDQEIVPRIKLKGSYEAYECPKCLSEFHPYNERQAKREQLLWALKNDIEACLEVGHKNYWLTDSDEGMLQHFSSRINAQLESDGKSFGVI